MHGKFILTAFGKDKPGCIADVTRMLYELGCNVEDSAMTRVAGEYAIILLFSGQEEGLQERMSKECRRLDTERGIAVYMRPYRSPESVVRKPYTTHVVHVEGADQAGIVYKVSRCLAENDVNVSDLRSKIQHSPESGEAIYSMRIEVEIPEGVELNTIREGLGRVESELHLEITLD